MRVDLVMLPMFMFSLFALCFHCKVNDSLKSSGCKKWQSHLELVLIVFQSLHDHAYSFHGAFQSSIHTIEAIHAPRHVYQHPQTLWLLLWTAQLQARFDDFAKVVLKNHSNQSQVFQTKAIKLLKPFHQAKNMQNGKLNMSQIQSRHKAVNVFVWLVWEPSLCCVHVVCDDTGRTRNCVWGEMRVE